MKPISIFSVRISLMLLLLFVMALPGKAQDVQTIQKSGDYLYAFGEARNYDRADRQALQNLVSQISVHVKSNFVNIVEQKNNKLDQYAKSVVKTYSNTTLPKTPSKVVERRGDTVKIMRYVKKENMDQVFENREKKIKDYVHLAIEAEKDYRVGDALKYYYWSLILLRSHPEVNELRFNPPSGDRSMGLLAYITDRINQVLGEVDINVRKTQSRGKDSLFVLGIKYQGHKVQNFDYKYFTGSGYSRVVSAKDGIGTVSLSRTYASNCKKVRLKAEYKYKNKSGLDLELRDVMDKTRDYIPYFKSATYEVSLQPSVRENVRQPRLGFKIFGPSSPQNLHYQGTIKKETAKETKQNKQSKQSVQSGKKVAKRGEADQVASSKESPSKKGSSKKVVRYVGDTSKLERFKHSISQVIRSIQSSQYDSCAQLFTHQGFDMFERLIEYGHATVLDKKPNLKILRVNDRYILRSIPMEFSFRSNVEDFVEEVTFTFNRNMKIEGLAFSLSSQSVEDIMDKGQYPEIAKYHLIEFMENYKTAYALERLDYIESIFAENALIIVGKVVKKAEKLDGMYKGLNNHNVKFLRRTKEEYITQLSRVFRGNEFVNIQFEEAKVRKRANDDIYGIQIAQNYYSQNYADKGYLFLMFNLSDVDRPKIHVRSWQPYKNAEGTPIPDSSVIGLHDFHF